MSSDAASSKTYIVSSDTHDTFEISGEVAALSQTITHVIEDNCAGDVIMLPNVRTPILSKVIEYCNRHVAAAATSSGEGTSSCKIVDVDLKAFDADFVNVDQATLIELILAADYMHIKPLLDLTCQTVAGMIKGKTPQAIREIFNITKDFTAEEEEDVRRENAWIFDSSAEDI